MPQAYSDPKRADSPTALPNVEYFYMTARELDKLRDDPEVSDEDRESLGFSEPGWYYWFCFPGCMPDSDPEGPFATEEECIADFTEESEADDV